MRRVLLCVLALGVVSGCVTVDAPATGSDAGATDTAESPTVTILRVVDGDTVKIAYKNGTEDTVRLVGIDTPEVHTENTPDEFEGVPDTAAGRDCLGRWGETASMFARQELADTTARLVFDENLGRRGYYGRLLAYVILDGENFNRRLVEEGYARVYDSEFSRNPTFRELETNARENATGLWECATETPASTTGELASPFH